MAQQSHKIENHQQNESVGDSYILVGVTGFEPATSCSQSRRSSQTEPHPDNHTIIQQKRGFVKTPCVK